MDADQPRVITVERDLRRADRCTPGRAIDSGQRPTTRSGVVYAEAQEQTRKRLVGRQIRRHRERAGLSQTRMGLALGVTQQQVSRWENGVWEPEYQRLVEIAQLLGVSWHVFYEPDDEAAA